VASARRASDHTIETGRRWLTASASANRSATSRATSGRTGGSTHAAVTSANSAASLAQSSIPNTTSTSTRRRRDRVHGSSARWCRTPRHAHACTARTHTLGSAEAGVSMGCTGGYTSSAIRSSSGVPARRTAAS
jgi:hypothetical protein